MVVDATQVDWSPEAGAALSRANASPDDLKVWREQRLTGEVQLWRFSGASVGYLLTRVEVSPDETRELVLVAGAGVNARPVLRWAKALAEQNGFDSIRTHIKRPGLRRMYEAQGWQLSELVMRVATHGR